MGVIVGTRRRVSRGKMCDRLGVPFCLTWVILAQLEEAWHTCGRGDLGLFWAFSAYIWGFWGICLDFGITWHDSCTAWHSGTKWHSGYLEGRGANWADLFIHSIPNAPSFSLLPLYCLSILSPLCFFSSGFQGFVCKARICNDLQKPQTGESCREFWAFRLSKSVVFRVVNATISGASEGVSGGSESHHGKNGGLLVRP